MDTYTLSTGETFPTLAAAVAHIWLNSAELAEVVTETGTGRVYRVEDIDGEPCTTEVTP